MARILMSHSSLQAPCPGSVLLPEAVHFRSRCSRGPAQWLVCSQGPGLPVKHGGRGESREPGAPCGRREGRGRGRPLSVFPRMWMPPTWTRSSSRPRWTDEIKFLKCLYEGVRTLLSSLVWSVPLASGFWPLAWMVTWPKVGQEAFWPLYWPTLSVQLPLAEALLCAEP